MIQALQKQIEEAGMAAFHLQLRCAIAEAPLLLRNLSSDEQKILARWNHPKRQQHWLMGRNALKQVLAQLQENNDTAAILFPHKQFSLTHSETMAIAIGISNGTTADGIGIDYEAFREIKAGALKFYLSQNEQEKIAHNDSSENLLRLWTVKEALFKADIQNEKTSYVDYEIDDLFTLTGKATCNLTHKVFQYTSLAIASGFISIAISQPKKTTA